MNQKQLFINSIIKYYDNVIKEEIIWRTVVKDFIFPTSDEFMSGRIRRFDRKLKLILTNCLLFYFYYQFHRLDIIRLIGQ